MEVPKQFVQLPGRVDALGPPSQDHPKVISLSTYQSNILSHSFNCSVRYTLKSQSLNKLSSPLHLYG